MARICLLVLLSISFVLTGTLTSQPAQADKRPGERTDRKGLRLVLINKAKKSCSSTSVNLEARLTNTSKKKIVIDKKSLWYSISIEVLKSETVNGADGTELGGGRDFSVKTILSPHYLRNTPDYIVLRPGQSFKDENSLVTANYKVGDRVRIQTTYGQFKAGNFQDVVVFRGTIESNTVQFRVTDCDGKQ